MKTLLVTGGAGFIGANFVLDCAGTSGEPRRQPRQADLRRQPRHARAVARRRRVTSSCTATSAIAALVARAARPSTSPTRDRQLRRRDRTSTARSTARPRSSQTNVVGTFALLEAARAYWRALPARARRRVPLPARLDRRGVRLARRRRPRSPRTTPYAPNSPVLGVEGGVRPPGARLPPHLRPAGADDELLEQLRAVPVSRKS